MMKTQTRNNHQKKKVIPVLLILQQNELNLTIRDDNTLCLCNICSLQYNNFNNNICRIAGNFCKTIIIIVAEILLIYALAKFCVLYFSLSKNLIAPSEYFQLYSISLFLIILFLIKMVETQPVS